MAFLGTTVVHKARIKNHGFLEETCPITMQKARIKKRGFLEETCPRKMPDELSLTYTPHPPAEFDSSDTLEANFSSKADNSELLAEAAALRQELQALAQTLDDYYERSVYVKAAGSAAAVAGGTIALVAGITAAVSTFGMATPLAAGAVMATAGSLTSGSASLFTYILERNNLKNTEDKWKSFKLKYFGVDRISAEDSIDGVTLKDDLDQQGTQPPEPDLDLQMDSLTSCRTGGMQPEYVPMVEDYARENLGTETAERKPLTEMVRHFLRFSQMFLDERKLEKFLQRQLSNAGREMGVTQGERFGDTMQRLADTCGVSMDDIHQILRALNQQLPQLRIMKHKERLENCTTDDVLDFSATFLAEKCTLSPRQIVGVLKFVYDNMTPTQKLSVFGGLVLRQSVRGAAQATMLAKSYGGSWLSWAGRVTGRAAGVKSVAAPAASSSGMAARFTSSASSWARSASAYVPSSVSRAGSAAFQASKSATGAVVSRTGQALSASRSLAGSAWTKSTQAYSAAKDFALSGALGKGGAGAGSRAAASTAGGGGRSLARALGTTTVVLNVACLSLSIHDLIEASVELRDKRTSKAGDYLRELASILPQ